MCADRDRDRGNRRLSVRVGNGNSRRKAHGPHGLLGDDLSDDEIEERGRAKQVCADVLGGLDDMTRAVSVWYRWIEQVDASGFCPRAGDEVFESEVARIERIELCGR